MGIVYGICAVLGGTVLVCQTVMTLLGLADVDDIDFPDGGQTGGHAASGHAGQAHGHDGAHHHHGANWFFGIVTFRTVVAALTFFGLGGLAAQSSAWGQQQPLLALVAALTLGWCAMYGVHWMMQALHRLGADGTARIGSTVGQTGSVYLRIPAHREGAGKVTVQVGNRTMEYQAMTSHEEIPTGARVVVVGVLGPDTLEVEPAPELETSQV